MENAPELYNPQQFVTEATKKTALYFLVDLSWVCYREYYANMRPGAYRMTVTRKGVMVPSSHVFGVGRAIMGIKSRFPNASIVLCRDGLYNARRDTNENYKSNRGKLPFDIHCDIAEMTLMFCRIPDVYFAYHQSREADDLMFSLSVHAANAHPGKKSIIFAVDKDLYQAVSAQTFCFAGKWDTTPLPLVDTAAVIEKFGVPPASLAILRSVLGDASDGLPSVPRFNRKFLVALLSIHSFSVENNPLICFRC